MQKDKNDVSEIASGSLLKQALKHTPAIKYAIAVAAIAGLIATSLRYGFLRGYTRFRLHYRNRPHGFVLCVFAARPGKQARYRIGKCCCFVVIPTSLYRKRCFPF